MVSSQAVPASAEMPRQNYVHPSQVVHGLVSSDEKSEHQVPTNGQSLDQGYLDVQTSHGAQFGPTTPSSSVNEQVGDAFVTTCCNILVQNDTIS